MHKWFRDLKYHLNLIVEFLRTAIVLLKELVTHVRKVEQITERTRLDVKIQAEKFAELNFSFEKLRTRFNEQAKADEAFRLDVNEQLQKILSALTVKPATKFLVELTDLDGTNPIGAPMTQKFLLPDSSKDKILRLKPLDADGFEAPIDGAAEFTSSDETLCTVTPQPDGKSARLTFLNKTPGGIITIDYKADADLGTGVKTIEDNIEIDFQAGEAATLGIVLEDAPDEPAAGADTGTGTVGDGSAPTPTPGL